MNPNQNLIRISKNISTKIEDELLRVGIFNRTFYRYKKEDSINLKFDVKNYDGETRFLQDIIGIRINLYFADDLVIVYNYFKKYFEFVDETIDRNYETEFKPTRLNLIFRIPAEYEKEFRDVITDKRIDNTFELQLRTVFSEGWHEVDHDLRYKAKEDWEDHQDLGRMFNGLLASLEANDWAIVQIFQNLAYRHYKKANLDSMFRSKMRIRIEKAPIKPEIVEIISSEKKILRLLYKIERTEILKDFLESNILMPLNINNFILMINFFYVKNKLLLEVTPDILVKEFNNCNGPHIKNIAENASALTTVGGAL